MCLFSFTVARLQYFEHSLSRRKILLPICRSHAKFGVEAGAGVDFGTTTCGHKCEKRFCEVRASAPKIREDPLRCRSWKSLLPETQQEPPSVFGRRRYISQTLGSCICSTTRRCLFIPLTTLPTWSKSIPERNCKYGSCSAFVPFLLSCETRVRNGKVLLLTIQTEI